MEAQEVSKNSAHVKAGSVSHVYFAINGKYRSQNRTVTAKELFDKAFNNK